MCKCKSEEHLGNFGDCPQCRKPAPHRHAALIKAWADGAAIEFSGGQEGWKEILSPSWDSRHSYRIKPESRPDIVIEHAYHCRGIDRIIWDLDTKPNVQFTFDGETGKLKSVCLV